MDISSLIELSRQRGIRLNRRVIYEIADTDLKRRYQLSDDLKRIRATYGHSFHVDVSTEIKPPPPVLYHGTAERFVDSIKDNGINPGNRQFVHLSTDRETAAAVGRRHGKPVVLKIDSAGMYREGIRFYSSHHHIWLTGCVPREFILNFS